MTPAETLRAAAAKVREAAGKATRGPWWADDVGVWIDRSSVYVAETGIHEADAAWIALMGPQVAEPLAALLSVAAEDVEDAEEWESDPRILDLARAFLGGTSGRSEGSGAQIDAEGLPAMSQVFADLIVDVPQWVKDRALAMLAEDNPGVLERLRGIELPDDGPITYPVDGAE